MQRECIKEAPTVEEAVDAALDELGVQQDAVGYEVLEEPGKRLFGLGSGRDARVRVWVKEEVVRALEQEASLDEDEEIDIVAPQAVFREDRAGELSDEELDKVADSAVRALKGLLLHFGIESPTVEEYEGDDGEIILDVVGGDLGLLIGRHGRTLDALQSVVAAIVTREVGFRYPVVVDIEGYRHRRRQKIEEMAKRAADRSVRQKTAIRLRPMTAYERRVVHIALRGDTRVVTGSEGADPYRQVVISPK
jgi:spoIIIJ-associated protein